MKVELKNIEVTKDCKEGLFDRRRGLFKAVRVLFSLSVMVVSWFL